jgi:Fe-S-cluster containining protein
MLNQKPPPGKEALFAHADALSAALQKKHHELQNVNVIRWARGIYHSDRTQKKKREAVLQKSHQLTAIVAPYVPCKKGCDFCCHFAVIIMQAEAEAIARHLGITRASPAHKNNAQRDIDVETYRGVACPFLKDSACSIYPIRPFLCRQAHTLNPDSSECSVNVPGEESFISWVPAIKLVEATYLQLMQDQNEVMADIREFFPDYQA